MSYLLTKDGAEIDLIIERAGTPTLCIEIKSGTIVHQEDMQNLIKLSADIIGSHAICLYTGEHRLRLGPVDVVPWREGLQEIGIG
jgi:hypothetical protein